MDFIARILAFNIPTDIKVKTINWISKNPEWRPNQFNITQVDNIYLVTHDKQYYTDFTTNEDELFYTAIGDAALNTKTYLALRESGIKDVQPTEAIRLVSPNLYHTMTGDTTECYFSIKDGVREIKYWFRNQSTYWFNIPYSMNADYETSIPKQKLSGKEWCSLNTSAPVARIFAEYIDKIDPNDLIEIIRKICLSFPDITKNTIPDIMKIPNTDHTYRVSLPTTTVYITVYKTRSPNMVPYEKFKLIYDKFNNKPSETTKRLIRYAYMGVDLSHLIYYKTVDNIDQYYEIKPDVIRLCYIDETQFGYMLTPIWRIVKQSGTMYDVKATTTITIDKPMLDHIYNLTIDDLLKIENMTDYIQSKTNTIGIPTADELRAQELSSFQTWLKHKLIKSAWRRRIYIDPSITDAQLDWLKSFCKQNGYGLNNALLTW